ncbi:MAG: hypothetical protein ACLFQY_02985 [Desulfococcaceae bacterium]
MQLPHPKTLYLPALSIVAMVLMLLLFIGFSTYQNLNRARTHALRFVHREGVALMQAIEAGARAWMMTPMWQGDSVERLIVETGRREDIAYIYLVDPVGRVIHHSGASIDSAIQKICRKEPAAHSRIRPSGNGSSHAVSLAGKRPGA